MGPSQTTESIPDRLLGYQSRNVHFVRGWSLTACGGAYPLFFAFRTPFRRLLKRDDITQEVPCLLPTPSVMISVLNPAAPS